MCGGCDWRVCVQWWAAGGFWRCWTWVRTGVAGGEQENPPDAILAAWSAPWSVRCERALDVKGEKKEKKKKKKRKKRRQENPPLVRLRFAALHFDIAPQTHSIARSSPNSLWSPICPSLPLLDRFCPSRYPAGRTALPSTFRTCLLRTCTCTASRDIDPVRSSRFQHGLHPHFAPLRTSQPYLPHSSPIPATISSTARFACLLALPRGPIGIRWTSGIGNTNLHLHLVVPACCIHLPTSFLPPSPLHRRVRFVSTSDQSNFHRPSQSSRQPGLRTPASRCVCLGTRSPGGNISSLL